MKLYILMQRCHHGDWNHQKDIVLSIWDSRRKVIMAQNDLNAQDQKYTTIISCNLNSSNCLDL